MSSTINELPMPCYKVCSQQRGGFGVDGQCLVSRYSAFAVLRLSEIFPLLHSPLTYRSLARIAHVIARLPIKAGRSSRLRRLPVESIFQAYSKSFRKMILSLCVNARDRTVMALGSTSRTSLTIPLHIVGICLLVFRVACISSQTSSKRFKAIGLHLLGLSCVLCY